MRSKRPRAHRPRYIHRNPPQGARHQPRPRPPPTALRTDGASKVAAPATASGKAAGALAAAASQHDKLTAFFAEARGAVIGKCATEQAEVLAAGTTKYQQLRAAIQQ